MSEHLEWLKVWGVNGSCFGIVTLAEFELWLKIIMLLLTIIYTGCKIVALIKEQE